MHCLEVIVKRNNEAQCKADAARVVADCDRLIKELMAAAEDRRDYWIDKRPSDQHTSADIAEMRMWFAGQVEALVILQERRTDDS